MPTEKNTTQLSETYTQNAANVEKTWNLGDVPATTSAPLSTARDTDCLLTGVRALK